MELAVAKPALMAAHEAVNCLDKASLTELKSFSKVYYFMVLAGLDERQLPPPLPWRGALNKLEDKLMYMMIGPFEGYRRSFEEVSS